MMSIYYKIWVDAIMYEKSKHGHLRNWKVYTLVPISIIQGVNLLVICIIIGFTIGKFPDIFLDFDVFPGKMLDSFLSGIITLFLPFLIINYVLIFHRKRYEILLTNYQHRNGKLYLSYFIVSMSLFILPLIFGKIFGLI